MTPKSRLCYFSDKKHEKNNNINNIIGEVIRQVNYHSYNLEKCSLYNKISR